MLKNTTIHVIIPAFNEENSIGKVINEIPKYVDKIIVCNNNSDDNTVNVALSAGAEVVNELKRGYGAACLAGIDYAKPYKPDIVVFLDGDYSDYPHEMDKLILPIIHNDVDFVIGSRVRGKKEKGALLPQAILGNFIACTLIRLFWGVKFSDLGPFRAIRFQKLLDMKMKDTTWGWTVEMQIKAAKMRMNNAEIPVSYRKRIGESKITGTLTGSVKAGWKIIYTIVELLVRR